MRALMTNIPQVNIWAEAEAFFDSISHADIALRILAATEVAVGGETLVQPQAARLRDCQAHHVDALLTAKLRLDAA